jgi:hypothetical protein
VIGKLQAFFWIEILCGNSIFHLYLSRISRSYLSSFSASSISHIKYLVKDRFMEYNPSAFLSADRGTSNEPTADLIILNQPLQDFETFKRIWSHTRYRICADGGANRLYNLFSGPLEHYRSQFVSPNYLNTLLKFFGL